MKSLWKIGSLAVAALFTFSVGARADFNLGDAANYALLFEGGGNNTLQITNVTTNTTGTGAGQGGGIGNIGVGGTGMATVSGPSTIGGSIDFALGNPNTLSNNNPSNVITGGVNYNVNAVNLALQTINALNTKLGAETGTNIAIANGGRTINTSQSTNVDASGNAVFNVTSFSSNVGDVLTINNNTGASGVVFNFIGLNANFGDTVILNGFTADQVVWNFVGGTSTPPTGGPTLQINTNQSSYPNQAAQGIFLDPNGPISIVNANVVGRVFGGDSHDMQYVSGSNFTAPTTPTPVPVPSSIALALTGVVPLGLAAALRRRRQPVAIAA